VDPLDPANANSYKNVYDVVNIFTTDLSTTRRDIPNMDKNTLTTAPIKRVGGVCTGFDQFQPIFQGARGNSLQLSTNRKYGLYLRFEENDVAAQTFTNVADKTTTTRQYDNAWSPRFGLIFQPNPKQSIFATSLIRSCLTPVWITIPRKRSSHRSSNNTKWG
jgi:iron complex outermembrane receptor protein